LKEGKVTNDRVQTLS